jgi:hypothetical protein
MKIIATHHNMVLWYDVDSFFASLVAAKAGSMDRSYGSSSLVSLAVGSKGLLLESQLARST